MPSQDIPPPLVGIVSLWVGTVLYGANIVMFIICFSILAKKRPIPWYLMVGICLQFALCTAHIGIILGTAINAFNQTINTTVAELVEVWLGIVGNWTGLDQVVYPVNNLIGDSILIWRLYVVYGNNWWVTILPIGLALASEGCTLYGGLSPFDNDHSKSNLSQIVIAGFSLTATTQLLVTTLIVGRIYTVQRSLYTELQGTHKSRYSGVMWMLVESGAALAAMEVIFLGTWRSNLGGLAQLSLTILGQLCTMVPLSIVTRVSLRLAFDGTTQRSGSGLQSAFRAEPGRSQFAAASGNTLKSNNNEVFNLSQLNSHDRGSQGKVEEV